MNLDSLVRSEFSKARERVRLALKTSYEPDEARTIIARYTGAFAVNFTDWIGKTLPWTRHERAQFALKDNLRCEQSEDHVGILLEFAFYAKVEGDPSATQEIIKEIRNAFRSTKTAALFGTALLATLEVMSVDFIPVLEDMGRDLGLEADNLEYTRVHGAADVAHADALTEALIAEAGEHPYPELILTDGVELAVTLIEKIFVL